MVHAWPAAAPGQGLPGSKVLRHIVAAGFPGVGPVAVDIVESFEENKEQKKGHVPTLV